MSHRRWMSARHRGDVEAARLTYAKGRNTVKTMMRQAKRKFEKGIANNSNTNPNAFWSQIWRRLKRGVAPLLEDKNDKEATKFEDEKKANIQKQCCSVFTREPEGEIPKLDIKAKVVYIT